MEQLLLHIVAFLRPIFFIEIGASNLFDIGGITAITVLGVAVLMRAATGKTLQLSAIDALIATFVLWCIAVTLIYPETLDGRGLVKLIAPFIGYTVAKNVILERKQYQRMLAVMIIGFIPPVVLSAVLILLGKGADPFGANYWTGIVRWAGAYLSAHDMGHNMTFLLMTMGVYFVVRFQPQGNRLDLNIALFIGTAILTCGALFCLWMSQVRTALLGLIVFAAVYMAYVNRRLLVIFSGITAVTVMALFPILKPILLPDLVMVEETNGSVEELASGRPGFWAHNLELFGNLSLDRQLSGVGIGFNRLPGFVDSHNDILDVLVQTGLVGFGLFASLQIMMFRRIGTLATAERHAFRAAFFAVLAMNFASNSYVARFGLAQMYYLIMAFIEIQNRGVRTATAGARAEESGIRRTPIKPAAASGLDRAESVPRTESSSKLSATRIPRRWFGRDHTSLTTQNAKTGSKLVRTLNTRPA